MSASFASASATVVVLRPPPGPRPNGEAVRWVALRWGRYHASAAKPAKNRATATRLSACDSFERRRGPEAGRSRGCGDGSVISSILVLQAANTGPHDAGDRGYPGRCPGAFFRLLACL